MRLFLIIFISIFLLSISTLTAQDIKRCKTPEVNNYILENNPDARKSTNKLEEFTQNFTENYVKSDQVYIIPIVFHILHDNGPENISKEQVLDAVRIINEDFRKQNSDTNLIIDEFKSIASDTYIEFRLAKVDPWGNCTDGITRYETDATYEANDYAKQVAQAWPRDMYLNVWVVHDIPGAAGYSYYPGSVDGGWGENVDGVILCYNYLGSISPSSGNKARTLTHEIGHYLNLMHPWGNSNEPGLQSNCDIDDNVSDTPNTIGSESCVLSQSTCGSLDNVQNYMDYSYCSRMFSLGQGERMQATLNSSTSGRNNLSTTSNLIATGTIDGFENLCPPIAEFMVDNYKGCEGFDVSFTNRTYGTNLDSCSYYWEFEGGTPSTSSDENPVVNYPTPGNYDVNLTVSNSSGTDILTKQTFIHSVDTLLGGIPPYTESFENSSFPVNLTDDTQSWENIEDGEAHWERTEVVSAEGNACLRIANYLNEEETLNVLVSPNLNISDIDSNLVLTFKVAYARKDVYSKDILQMRASPDCGHYWSIRYYKQGSSSLITAQNDPVSGTFIPTEDDWREETVDLGYYLNKSYIMLKFMVTSRGGNYLYMDDIRLNGEPLSTLIEKTIGENLLVYPNPFDDDTRIELYSESGGNADLEITDINGRRIAISPINIKSGSNYYKLSSFAQNLRPGIYFIRVTSDNINEMQKIIKL